MQGWSKAKCLAITGVIGLLFGGIEVALVEALMVFFYLSNKGQKYVNVEPGRSKAGSSMAHHIDGSAIYGFTIGWRTQALL